jgi:hypothetical protein
MASDSTYTFGGKNESASDPADDYVTVVPGAGELANGVCKAILCSADGALKLTTWRGTVRDNVPVQKGYNPLRAKVIDVPTVGAAPATVVALY